MRLCLDESVSVALAPFLAQHGFHCLTARDAGHLGTTDEQQLPYAEESECARLPSSRPKGPIKGVGR
ncbi:MAG: DUF5615 family PIN-like protein [Nitrospiraceae bacterium]